MPAPAGMYDAGGSGWFNLLQQDPQFQQLSPEAQQILGSYAQKIPPGPNGVQAFAEAIKSDPQLQSAMQEAKSSGALDHPMTAGMKILTAAMAAVVGGFGVAALGGIGAAAPTVSGAADSSYIGADVASTAASALGGNSILKTVGNLTGKVAPILGNMAKSGAEANANRDRILPSMEMSKLARDKYALDAPGTRLTQSTKASILKSASPTQVNWAGPGSGLKGQVPTFTGGYSGALANIDPRTKSLADEVMNKDLTDQLAGKDGQTPYLDQFGKTSAMDKAVGGASVGASIWDAVKGIWK